MDYTITAVPRRSLVRRLAPWAASLGLFAGGGYGVYRYALPGASSAHAAEPQSATAQDSLLAGTPSSAAATTPPARYTTPFDPPAVRYGAAPALPPALDDDEEVTTPRSAAAVDPPVNPFAAMPPVTATASYDSYVAPPAAGVEAAQASTPENPADVPSASATTPAATEELELSANDIARGQEPAVANPLRGPATGQSTALRATPPVADPAVVTPADVAGPSEADEARAAFSDAAVTNPPAAGYDNASTTPAPVGSQLMPVDASARYGAPQSITLPAAEAEPPVADPAAAARANPMSAAPNPFAAAPVTRTAPPSLPPAAAIDSAPAATTPQAYAMPSYAAPVEPPVQDSLPPNYTAAASAGPLAEPITPTPGLTAVDGTGRPGDRALEGVQAPALSIQKSAPPEIQVGKKCTFSIRVINNGQRPAQQVQVVDEVPLGTQLIGTMPKAVVSGSKVAWDLGTIPAGEERILELELMPTAEGELGSVATVTFAGQAAAKTRSTRPQLTLRLVANPRVMIGEEQLVQIEISNPGSGDATGVMLLENIPAGVAHEAGPALEFEVGTLRAGETKQLPLVLKAMEAGLIDNIMTARADANLQVQASCQFEIIAPQLKVSIEGPARRVLERPATYQVTVDNPGTAAARDVQLVTQLPPGMKYVSANNSGEYDAATHSVYWSIPELQANDHGAVELTTLAVAPGEQTLQVATQAQQGLEDRAEARVLVEGIVALGFEVQDVKDAIEVGGETSYEIRVTNQGTKTATNVQVVATLSAGLRAQLGQGDARYTVQGDRVVFAPIAQIPPKADATLRFGVQGVQAGDQRVTLQVTTDEVSNPIVESESTQVYADE